MEQLNEIVSIKPSNFISSNLMKLCCAKSGQLCEGSVRNTCPFVSFGLDSMVIHTLILN